MSTHWIDILGYLAAACTTLAYLPQVIMVWRTKDASGVSWGMVLLLCIGLSLWFLYGVAIHRYPVIIVNGLTLILTSSMVVLKLKYDAARRQTAQ